MKRATEKIIVNIMATLLLAFVFAVLFFYASGLAQGQSLPKLTWAQERYAFALARVSAHEGALTNLRDVDLVHQVAITNAATPQKQLEFLHAHSGRSLGDKPCTDANCEWSPKLNRAGTVPAAQAAGKDAAYWRVVVMPRWRSVLARARVLASGAVPYSQLPCKRAPVTWGSVRLDSKKAASHGLYPLGCSGTLNDGFAPVSRETR